MKRIVRNKLRWAAVSAVAGMAAFAGQSKASTKTWDGGGADNNINTAANWVGDTNPNLTAGSGTNADDWVFTGTTGLNPTINVFPANLANNVTFDANAGAFTLTVPTGTNFAAFGTTAGTASTGGNFTNNSTNVQTLSGNLASRFGTVNANTGAFVINGEWILGNTGISGSTGTNAQDGRTNTFTGSNNVTIHAQLTSVGRLLKQGTGTLFLDNDANDYSGTTRIEQGAVQISVPNALGTYGAPVSRGTTVAGNANSFGRLELASGTNAGIAFSASETLTLEARQGAAATAPHLVNVSGNNTWQAPITLTTGGSEYTIVSSGGSLNISGNITDGLAGVRNMYFDGAANGEVSGGLLATNPSTVNLFTVTKNGTGTWTFSGSNTFNGALTVNAGKLVISNFNNTSGAVTVNGGTLAITSTGSLSSVPSITLNSQTNSTLDVSDYTAAGGYNLTGGTVLNGGGHVKGQFNVGGGAAITAGSALSPTTFTFENGLSLTGGGAYNAFFSGANHSLIDVTGGTLSATSSNDIRVSGAGVVVGQYPLLHYTGTLGGDGFSAFNLAQLPPRATATLVNNTTGHSIDLNITAIDMPKWTGAVDANWDINSTSNWKEVNSGKVTTYLEPFTPGDAVLFDDTAVGNTTVALNTTVNPSLVTANNATLTYTISGTGSINGSGSIVKNGAGKFIIANTGGNNYTGPTFINAGTLQLGDDTGNGGGGAGVGTGDIHIDGTLAVNRNDDVLLPNILIGNGRILKQGTGALSLGGNSTGYNGTITVAQGTLRGSGMTNFGSTNAAIVVLDGATLDTNFTQMGAKTITAQGKGVGQNGAIVNNGGGQNNTLESVILAGDTTFGGTGRWDIRNLGNLTQLSTTGHAYNITKVGSNQTDLVGVTVDPALADININSGTLGIEAGTTGLGNANNTVTIAGGANFLMFNYGTLDKKFVSNGGAIQATSGGNNALAGTIVLNNDSTVQVNSGVTLSLNNLVSGAGGLIKTQTGTLNLVNPANTYTGANNLTGTVVVTTIANGGQASSIGASGADASNLILNAINLRYTGAAASTTDRAMNITGNSTIEAAGATPAATVAFTNPAPLTVSNPTTNVATLTLTGANTGANVFAPSLTDTVGTGSGSSTPLSLVKAGFGTWVLPTANTFTGNVVVSGGQLRVRSGSALGANNQVQVNDNTANPNPASVVFDDPNGVTVANNFRTTGGGGGGANPDGPGVIRAAAGNNVLSGTITMSSGGGFSTYTADAGATLNFAGTITNDTARTMDVGGNGTVIISGSLNDGTGISSIEKRGAGTALISSTTSNYTGSTVVNSGTLRVTGSIATSSGVTVNNAPATFEAAAPQTVKALTVTAGRARVASAASKIALTVGDGTQANSQLSLTGGTLDLTTNGVAIHYSAGNDATVLASTRAQLIAGYGASGDWKGATGITSSTAVANPLGAVGYALASDVLPFTDGSSDTFLGTTIDKNTVIARYTLSGDLNLDGSVDFLDLAKLAQSYNVTDGTRQWSTGDVNYDGNTDFLDLAKMAQNYNTALGAPAVPGASADFNADLARAFAAVPEPGTISLLGLGAVAMLGRRRRRHTKSAM
jgi:autotransporter-associated beta strand protein